MSVGADVENGKYAMMGARLGMYNTVLDGLDHLGVRDLDNMENVYNKFFEENDIDQALRLYGESLRQRMDVPLADFTAEDSKFFKFAMNPHKNKGVQDREYK